MFYAVNGWWLMTTQEDLVDLVLDVVEGRLRGVGAISDRLSRVAKELPDAED